MKRIGQVAVDSGRIRIGDPCYVSDHPELCVDAPTGIGDGTFPVFEMEVGGMKFLAVQLDPYGIDLKELFKDQGEK